MSSRSTSTQSSNPRAYCARVRQAHALAELLKRVKPELIEKVSELQCIVTQAHQKLEELDRQEQMIESLDAGDARKTVLPQTFTGERTAALAELQNAYQRLQNLKHCK